MCAKDTRAQQQQQQQNECENTPGPNEHTTYGPYGGDKREMYVEIVVKAVEKKSILSKLSRSFINPQHTYFAMICAKISKSIPHRVE